MSVLVIGAIGAVCVGVFALIVHFILRPPSERDEDEWWWRIR